MADTKRSMSALMTILADGQAADEISEQDIRDCIWSQKGAYGAAEMEDNATATTIGTVSTWTDIAGILSGTNSHEMTISSAGVITYTGSPDMHFTLAGSLTFTSASNNQLIEFAFFKNGSTKLPAKIGHKALTGTDEVSVSVHADTTLSTNDTIQIRVQNATGANNVTVTDAYWRAMGHII